VKKYRIGYTQGVFDMFHVGHLNILLGAKQHCDYLMVGVNADSLVEKYKNKCPVIPEADRCIIVSNIRAVDECFLVETLDKEEILKQHKFDAVFIGDDWKNSPRWLATEEALAKYGVDVVYLPHTEGISSTQLRQFAPQK